MANLGVDDMTDPELGWRLNALFIECLCRQELEVRFKCELIFPRGVVRIGLRYTTECRVSKACPAAAVSDVEVRSVRDIEALRAELYL